jgi:hypothetical protein
MAESKRRGLWNRWVYLNYASQWQDPIQGYEITNKLELQSVSSKYDPLAFSKNELREASSFSDKTRGVPTSRGHQLGTSFAEQCHA